VPETPIGRLRLVGVIEAISFLVLLGVAMPLKYLAGEPLAVKIVGWIHGLLFILFCFALNGARTAHDWPTSKSLRVLVAALLPFGPFVIDRGLREEERATEAVS
jgi:integral membrane protein